MTKTFKCKLYKSKHNKKLHKQIGIAAEIYNHCIALHKRYYRLYKKSLKKYQLQKHLTKLKKQKNHLHWKQVGSQAIQDITDRIERAYKLFFNSCKSSRKVSPPNFKKTIKYKSITLKQAGYELYDDNRIRIGKHIYKFHKSREVEGVIKTLTVKRDSLGDIYIFFSCKLPDIKVERTMTGRSAGFDFGLKTFLVPSDDNKDIDSPLFFNEGIKKIRKASKNVSSKKKGSNNRKKAKLDLARDHKKITNKRNDYLFKLAKKFVKAYDNMFFEDLHMKAMQMMWGRKVSDLGFSKFLSILEYVCKQAGSKVVFIDRFFPSSKLCSNCGNINKNLRLRDRLWTCSLCKKTHNRDKNAAINIYREGAFSLGLGSVRPQSGNSCLIPESQLL